MRTALLALMTLACSPSSDRANNSAKESFQLPERTVELDKDVDVRSIIELGDGTVLFGGRADANAAVFRLTDAGVAQVYGDDRGHVECFAVRGATIFAGAPWIWKKNFLIRSDDGGRTWTPKWSIPADSIGGLVADPEGLWIYGAEALLRSDDDGKTWSPVPMAAPWQLDTQFAAPSKGLIQFGDSYWLTSDRGETWTKPYGDVVIRVADERHEFGIERLADGSYRVVRLGEAELEAIGSSFSVHDAIALRVNGNQIAVLADPPATTPGDVYQGLFYLVSSDRGTTWKRSRIRARTSGAQTEFPAFMGKTHEIVTLHDGRIGFVKRPR